MAKRLEIRWSKKAIQQIKKIGEYIEVDSPWQAERIVTLIYRAPERLQFSKEIGKISREFGDPYIRELSVYSYRIIYRIKKANLVEIASVVHGRRMLRPEHLG